MGPSGPTKGPIWSGLHKAVLPITRHVSGAFLIGQGSPILIACRGRGRGPSTPHRRCRREAAHTPSEPTPGDPAPPGGGEARRCHVPSKPTKGYHEHCPWVPGSRQPSHLQDEAGLSHPDPAQFPRQLVSSWGLQVWPPSLGGWCPRPHARQDPCTWLESAVVKTGVSSGHTVRSG